MKLGPEDKIQLAILEYLDAVLPDALVAHIPNGGRRSLTEGLKFKLLGVRAGFADLIVMHGGRCLFLEVKAPKGRVSDEQRSFGEHARAVGAEWFVVRGVDDVRAALAAGGITTREAA